MPTKIGRRNRPDFQGPLVDELGGRLEINSGPTVNRRTPLQTHPARLTGEPLAEQAASEPRPTSLVDAR
jgi:hypothetical protein